MNTESAKRHKQHDDSDGSMPSLADIKRELDRIGRKAKWEARADKIMSGVPVVWFIVVLTFIALPISHPTAGWANIVLALSLGYSLWFSRRMASLHPSKPQGSGPAPRAAVPSEPNHPRAPLNAKAHAEVERMS